MSLALLTLTACSTLQTPPSASDSFCLIAKRITYTLVPRAERAAAAAENRPVEDDGNRADSAPTIEQIGVHNAKLREVCPTPPDSG